MTIGISKAKLPLGIVLAALLICLLAVSLNFAADETSAKVQALRQTGKQLLEVGGEQYRRGMYDNAKETLGKAAAYKEYLSISDASKLDELLEKLGSQTGPQVQQPADQNTTAVKTKPAASGQIEVQPEFITPAPQEPNIQIEGYQPQQPQAPVAPAVEKTKEDYIEVVKQKQRIQQSYTMAVVNEAIAKAKEYADKEDFLKAKDEISRASGVIEKNKLLLGDADYAQYSASLQQLLNQINTRQTEVERLKAEKAKTEAKTTQGKLRTQQTADRQKRIQELLTSSMEYQEQQKYPEALAQLETLLAIDQTNREAIRNKQMLEDIINLRRQLDVKKEMGREEQNVLYEGQKSMVPPKWDPRYAGLFTYPSPRNWQDIAKRKPEAISGLTSADAEAYKQLDTLVDLSALTPDTPLNEAIEIIRNSVDPPLRIIVLWKDLEENVYIEPDTVIGMQGLAGIPLGEALTTLLSAVSGGVAKIDFAVKYGIITIATTQSLPPNQVTHVYDIADLVTIPADFQTQLSLSGLTGTGGTGGGEIGTDEGQGEQDTLENRVQRANNIVTTIQTIIEPMSWLVNGGQGNVSLQGTKLVISQTPKIHEQIQDLLKNLRESHGQQVSIETRFLFVTENFLEDIGFGISRIDIPAGKISNKLGGMIFQEGSSGFVVPEKVEIPGNLPSFIEKTGAGAAVDLVGGVQYGSVLDDLTVSFFLRATQAHRDAKILTAPRFTVLNGERGYVTVGKQVSYISDWSFQDITAAGADQPTRETADPTPSSAGSGVTLEVRPTISDDKKYVDLRIRTNYTKLRLDDFVYNSPQGVEYKIQLPTWEPSVIQTHVSIPDGGTLLIGGQKLGAEINREAGVPGLSKVPILGRLFSARTKTKDQDILLILVKPTIVLQEEAEREFFAPLE